MKQLAMSAALPLLLTPALAAQVTMTAEQVAAQARQGLKCPPPAVQRPAGRPVDDVLGVRPGMGFEQAQQAVLCSDPLLVARLETSAGYRLESFGQKPRQGFMAEPAQPKVERSGREWAREMQDRSMARGMNRASDAVAPGQSRWWVATMGLPGQEQALFVRREEIFADAQRPSLASAEQTLAAKFGAPHQRFAFSSEVTLYWDFDPKGAPLRRDGCHVPAQINGNLDLKPGCGLSIAVRLQPSRDNPGMAHSMAIGITDHANGIHVLESTEKALRQIEDERRRKEVDKAGGAPKPRV